MGYRSEVGIKCREKAFELFRKAIIEQAFFPSKVYKNNSGEYTIYWSWVKWYDGYPEVSAIEDVMKILNKESYADNEEYGYRFLRIGEDQDDNEERENDYSLDFYIERSIYIEEGQDEIKTAELLQNR